MMMLLRIFSFCSPLFWVVQAVLSFSVVSGDMDVINDAVLYLLCIFRAIRRAEDAVDAQRTPVSIVPHRDFFPC